jgi:hypothetical protein
MLAIKSYECCILSCIGSHSVALVTTYLHLQLGWELPCVFEWKVEFHSSSVLLTKFNCKLCYQVLHPLISSERRDGAYQNRRSAEAIYTAPGGREQGTCLSYRTADPNPIWIAFLEGSSKFKFAPLSRFCKPRRLVRIMPVGLIE